MRSNFMDQLRNVFNTMYSWDGSLGRLEYFMYGLLSSLVSCILLALINPVLDSEGSFFVVLSISLLLLALSNAAYTSVVLVIKRLRSMGLDTVHIWWISGLWLVTSIHSYGEPESIVTYCLVAIDLLVSLWLLFTPAKK